MILDPDTRMYDAYIYVPQSLTLMYVYMMHIFLILIHVAMMHIPIMHFSIILIHECMMHLSMFLDLDSDACVYDAHIYDPEACMHVWCMYLWCGKFCYG